MSVALDGAQLLARKAAWAHDCGRDDAAELGAMAFLFAAEQAQRTSDRALHFHGGYGFMEEYDIQLFYRRAKGWANVLDEPAREYARLADEVHEKRIQFYIAVEKLLTPEQRHTALHKLQEFAEDFNSLSKKPVKAASHTDDIAMLAWLCAPGPHACIPE